MNPVMVKRIRESIDLRDREGVARYMKRQDLTPALAGLALKQAVRQGCDDLVECIMQTGMVTPGAFATALRIALTEESTFKPNHCVSALVEAHGSLPLHGVDRTGMRYLGKARLWCNDVIAGFQHKRNDAARSASHVSGMMLASGVLCYALPEPVAVAVTATAGLAIVRTAASALRNLRRTGGGKRLASTFSNVPLG